MWNSRHLNEHSPKMASQQQPLKLPHTHCCCWFGGLSSVQYSRKTFFFSLVIRAKYERPVTLSLLIITLLCLFALFEHSASSSQCRLQEQRTAPRAPLSVCQGEQSQLGVFVISCPGPIIKYLQSFLLVLAHTEERTKAMVLRRSKRTGLLITFPHSF